MNPASTADAIVAEITIHASAERVFDALAQPAERVQWWGAPGRFETKHMESDLRPGGKWMMSGDGMNGQPFTIRGEYREVRRPHVLAFTWLPSWQDDDTESFVRVELTETNGVTHVRLTHSQLSDAARAIHRGWPDILAWLKRYAEGAQ